MIYNNYKIKYIIFKGWSIVSCDELLNTEAGGFFLDIFYQ